MALKTLNMTVILIVYSVSYAIKSNYRYSGPEYYKQHRICWPQ